LAVAAFFMLACSSESGSDGGSNGGGNNSWGESGSVIGAWELTSFNEGGDEARPRVYIALYENNTFDLYQQFQSIEWLHYKGTFTFDGTLLSGEYQDGKAWGNAYSVEFANNPARLRLTCSNGTESYIYTAVEEIPQTIVDDAKEPVTEEVRSVEAKRFL
jgi:hypothetical protein